MNSISNISILPEINSTSIWHTLVDNVLNGIAYLFAAILSTRARKIETAPVGVLQNTSAIETVLISMVMQSCGLHTPISIT